MEYALIYKFGNDEYHVTNAESFADAMGRWNVIRNSPGKPSFVGIIDNKDFLYVAHDFCYIDDDM